MLPFTNTNRQLADEDLVFRSNSTCTKEDTVLLRAVGLLLSEHVYNLVNHFTPSHNVYFSLQGFLSDLLEKANKPYEEPKLQEYTQTIVSVGSIWPSMEGYSAWKDCAKPR